MQRYIPQVSDPPTTPNPPPSFAEAVPDERQLTSAPVQCVPWGLLVVDREMNILFANRKARQFLGADDGVSERNGKLSVERASSNRALVAMVEHLSGNNAPPSNIIGVPGRQGSPRYAIRGMPCEHIALFGENRVLVLIADLLDSGSATRETVARIFSLSEREAEFAELFASGLRLGSIAKEMGVALNTVRVHLRHVFAKTGTTNQIELARKFARLP